jgi:parallel beta-helix repeat protein
MIRRCYRLVFSLIFLLTMAVNVSADTTISGGPITADTTWALSGSPYIVNGSILVMTGVTLTIEPGVEIRFGEGNSFQVDGTLIAKGTESQKITFTANNSGINWGYLLFSTSSTDATYDTEGNYTGGSILRHCIIEYAGGADVENNGAVRLDDAHPFFNHVTIRNNQTSGIKAWDISGTIKIINSTVSNNTSSYQYDGGGIDVEGKGTGSTVYIFNSTIDNNIGGDGGGIYLTTQNVTLEDNTITNNKASTFGSGGGIYFSSYNSNAILKNNTITNNTANGHGGGIYLSSSNNIVENNTMTGNTGGGYGGGIYLDSSNSIVENNTMTNNTAEKGGGIYVRGGKTTISNNTIDNNTATDDVGGAYLDGSDIKFFDNIVSSNIAKNSIGGVYILRGTVSNNFITGNSAANAIGGIALYSATVTNNTIDGNSGGLNIVTIENGGTFQYNDIKNNITANSADVTYTIWVDASHPLIKHNNIFGNTATYELWHNNKHGSDNVSAENNWWGTNDGSAILEKIHDFFDDSEKGVVSYAPWESAIRTDAGVQNGDPPPVTLTINKAGNGNVTGNGIDCGSVCTKEYAKDTAVTLTATPTGESQFAGWDGAGCSGTENCTVTMSESQTVTATFEAKEDTPVTPVTLPLNVNKNGSGTGNVIGNDFDCGSVCTKEYAKDTEVILTATPTGESLFVGWDGAGCSGTGNCTVTMSENQTVTATFNLEPPLPPLTLSVHKNGDGTGNVIGNGIDCGSVCSKEYTKDTAITLTTTHTGESQFASWSGAGCSGTGNCTVTMNENKTVTATFNKETPSTTPTIFTLIVNRKGTTAGNITGNGIDCGSSSSVCTKEYAKGTEVTLTATPIGDSFFVGWSGAGCSGTDNCTVTMTEDQRVAATFRPPATLNVNTNGNGTVTGVGINCGSDCTETFEKGKQVALKAIAEGDYVFDDWSGECSGKIFCTITMNADKTMTANFSLPKTTLTVDKEGNGTVESSPSGINCGSDCEERYDTTDEITLTAEPKADYLFEEWEGDCDLVNTADDCIVTMETDKEVTAIFATSGVANLEFRGLKDFYQVGETLVMELVEMANRDKYTRVDLWVAIELPSRDFLFRTEIPLTPWHPNMQPHKTSIENTETSHHIFDFEVPEGIGGDYTLYAAYVKEGENPVTSGFSIRSNLVIRQVFLAGRKN